MRQAASMAREAREPRVLRVGRGKCQPWKKQQQIAPSVDTAVPVYQLSCPVCFPFRTEITERVSVNEYLSTAIKHRQNWVDTV